MWLLYCLSLVSSADVVLERHWVPVGNTQFGTRMPGKSYHPLPRRCVLTAVCCQRITNLQTASLPRLSKCICKCDIVHSRCWRHTYHIGMSTILLWHRQTAQKSMCMRIINQMSSIRWLDLCVFLRAYMIYDCNIFRCISKAFSIRYKWIVITCTSVGSLVCSGTEHVNEWTYIYRFCKIEISISIATNRENSLLSEQCCHLRTTVSCFCP